eukprot:8988082-Alexandrium_andersonii.AAC.1
MTGCARWKCEREGVWVRRHDSPRTTKFNPDFHRDPGGPNVDHLSGRRVTVVRHPNGHQEEFVDREYRSDTAGFP